MSNANIDNSADHQNRPISDTNDLEKDPPAGLDTSALDLSSLDGLTGTPENETPESISEDPQSSSDDDSLNMSSLSIDAHSFDKAQDEKEEKAIKEAPSSAAPPHVDDGKDAEWREEHGSEALYRDTVSLIESGSISIENGIMLLKKAANEGCALSWIYLGKLYSNGSGELYNPPLAFECFSKAARLESGEGCYYLGLCFANGIGCKADQLRAEAMFSKGGELDHAESFFALGICRERGIGCEIDYPMAVKLYEYGSQLGSANSTNNLGGCYFYGHGVEQDKIKAAELYCKAAEMGSANARCRLGICYETGDGCERDPEKAFELYGAAAEDGNAIALYRLALCYDKGIGTEQNFAQAFKYYNLSAEKGHAPAMHESGLMSKTGRGTQKSASAAYKMFSLAAEAGFSPSEFEVGNCYFEGIGTVRNLEFAFCRYEHAYNADNGNAEAAFKLGLCCLKGLGTKKDPARAFEWFSKSAEAGSLDAMYMRGECCFFGIGTEENKKMAVKCYEMVAMQDESNVASTKSFIALGRCLEHAIGTVRDPESALALYKKAAEYGDAEAMYCAGRLIMSGVGAGSEQSTARGYVLRSARNAYVPAMLAMGIFAEEGRGVVRNSVDAEKWYSRAVNAELKGAPDLYDFPERFYEKAETESSARIEAQYRLGMTLARNDPSLRSYIKAFEYIASAASLGHEDAQLEITRIYVHGGDLKSYYESAFTLEDGVFENGETTPSKDLLGNAMNKLGDAYFDGKALVEKNKVAATRCYKIAAEIGNVDASYSYGWCLRHGSGIRENDVEAVKWLKIAADKGNINAAYSYGLCCEEGAGTGIKNKREARSYYRKAASAGHADAAKRYISLSE